MNKILLLIILTLPAICYGRGGVANSFTENKGQIKDQHFNTRNDIDLVLKAEGISIYIGSGSLHYQFAREDRTNTDKEKWSLAAYRMDVELIGANKDAKLVLEKQQPYYERYYISGAPERGWLAHSYSRVTYTDIYPGIDWVLYIKDNKLKHEFIVADGADPSMLRIKYSGADVLRINIDGSLEAVTPFGNVTEARPYSYASDETPVTSAYKLDGDILSFELGEYAGKLIIDPTLDWATYYHGSFNYPLTTSTNIALTNDEYIYMCGMSGAVDIATTGAHQVTIAGLFDAFLVKFDSSGNRLWCTYYGGNAQENAAAVAHDGAGAVYIVGQTESNDAIATQGSFQENYNDSADGFIVKFDSTGARIWGTYYGGISYDGLTNITIDSEADLYINGGAVSEGLSTPGAYQELIPGDNIDAIIMKFDSSGNRVWCSYFGGPEDRDDIDKLALDGYGHFYFSGRTYSSTGISTPGCHQPTLQALGDGFIGKMDTSGSLLLWGTYYGGEGLDGVGSICLDHQGDVLVTGSTGNANFPASTFNIATPGSYMENPQGSQDGFLVKFDTSGQRLWGTYYGGNSLDHNGRICIDNWGNIYQMGITRSLGLSTPGTWQTAFGGGLYDALITKFDNDGEVIWATYYGGLLDEAAYYIAWDGVAHFYVSGVSASNNAIATPGAFQSDNPNGYRNAFLSRFEDCIIPLQPDSMNIDTVCADDTIMLSVPIVNGALTYTWTLPGGWSGSSTTNSINVTTGTTGGVVTVTAHSVCGSSPVLSINAYVYPAPVPLISQSGNQLSTGNYTSYQWYESGSPIMGATGQTYTFTQAGVYTVLVTDINGCAGMSAPFTLGIEYVKGGNSISMYPNPNSGAFVLDVSGNGTIEVYDATGRSVFTRQVKKGTSDITLPAHCVNGIYLLRYVNERRDISYNIPFVKINH